MSTKLFNTAAAGADPAGEEEAIEIIETIAGNDDEENAAVSNGTESNISSDAAASYARQGTTFFSKRGPAFAVGALAAVVIGGVASVHLAGRPTKNFSSSKQVALASGDIKIKGFTFLWAKDNAKDECGDDYDYVRYGGVADAKACSNLCSACPGRGQTDINGVKLVFRGFEFVKGFCFCLVDNGADLTNSVCAGAGATNNGNEGSGEIKSVESAKGSPECWKINSKSSKSPKSGSKGGKGANNDIIPTRKLGPNIIKKEVRSR